MRYTSADDHGNSRWRFSHNSNAVFFLISSYSKLVEIIDVWSHRKIGMNSNGYFIASCSVLPTNSYLLLVQSFIITDIIVIMFFFRLHFFILFLYFDSMKQCCRVKKHMKKKNESTRQLEANPHVVFSVRYFAASSICRVQIVLHWWCDRNTVRVAAC